MNQIDRIEKRDKIGYFTDGLKEATKRFVKFSKPKDLEKAILIAENYDSFQNGTENKNESSNLFYLNSKRRSNKMGHKSDCKSINNIKSKKLNDKNKKSTNNDRV